MKKLIFISAALLLGFTSQAQEWAEDSVAVGGSSAAKQVYYSFSTRQKHIVDANSWHLAFSVQPSQFPNNTLQGTTIRINNGRNVRVFVAPANITVDSFTTLDTTGMRSTWTELFDSDSTWDLGAFNTGLNLLLPPHLGGPDYGWGAYNSTSHDVVSKGRIYVILQGSAFVKKLYFGDLVRDTAFNFTHANLDNSNHTSVELVKNQYPNKFFAYYDLVNDEIRNLEPLKEEWDVVFTEYYTYASGFNPITQEMQWQFMSVPGTLSKKGVKVARIEDIHPDSAWKTQFTLSDDIKTIGYDWKTHIGGGVYAYKDSLSFIIDNGGDNIYVLHFTKYSGSALRQMNFEFQTLVKLIGSVQTNQFSNISIYPNPVNDKLHIDMDETASFEVIDMQGKVLLQTSVETGLNGIDFSGFNQGIYIVRISNQHKVYTQRIIKTN